MVIHMDGATDQKKLNITNFFSLK